VTQEAFTLHQTHEHSPQVGLVVRYDAVRASEAQIIFTHSLP
jgi:hypothetical protein